MMCVYFVSYDIYINHHIIFNKLIDMIYDSTNAMKICVNKNINIKVYAHFNFLH